jgi:hypothetical protein
MTALKGLACDFRDKLAHEKTAEGVVGQGGQAGDADVAGQRLVGWPDGDRRHAGAAGGRDAARGAFGDDAPGRRHPGCSAASWNSSGSGSPRCIASRSRSTSMSEASARPAATTGRSRFARLADDVIAWHQPRSRSRPSRWPTPSSRSRPCSRRAAWKRAPFCAVTSATSSGERRTAGTISTVCSRVGPARHAWCSRQVDVARGQDPQPGRPVQLVGVDQRAIQVPRHRARCCVPRVAQAVRPPSMV